jgi:hypothetical protein
MMIVMILRMAMLMMRVTLLDLKDVVGNFPPHPMLR